MMKKNKKYCFQIQGSWAFQQYFASSEEALSYHCMLADMAVDMSSGSGVRVTMSFRYSYLDDPLDDVLTGNMTWIVPDEHYHPAHWEHAEQPCNYI
jgi:apolipoprotein D and lipocalin family protein